MHAAGRSDLTKEIVGGMLIAGAWLALQGFQFGIANNIFHIPFVLRWYELPQYANDAFYQTLPSFTSALWWLVRLFATEDGLQSQFLAIHILGRVGAVVALVIALRSVVPSVGLRLLAVLFAVSTPLLRSESYIGGHGIFIGYLTHTEFLWPFFVAALACAERGYWRWAAAMAAVTFSLNAFVGLWCAAVLAAAVYLRPPRPSFKIQLQAAFVFAVLALPVVLWILQVTSGASPGEPFSFRDYIRAYYPGHFLIEAAHWLDVLNLVAVVALTSIVSRQFGWRFWNLAVLTLAGLFVLGAVLPYLLDSRVIFNLHFLRVDGAIVFLSTPLLAAAGLRNLLQSTERSSQVQGCLLLLGCIAGQLFPVLVAWAAIQWLPKTSARLAFSLIAALLFSAACALHPHWLVERPAICGVAALCFVAVALSTQSTTAKDLMITALGGVMLLALLAGSIVRVRMGIGGAIEALLGFSYLTLIRHRELIQRVLGAIRIALTEPGLRRLGVGTVVTLLIAMQAASAWSERPAAHRLTTVDRDWIAATAWVHDHKPETPVLIPLKPAGLSIDHDFQLYARTPVWVDWKQGAAVMWSPSFHSIWRKRFDAVRQLHTPAQFAQYAQDNGIAMFVVPVQAEAPESCTMGNTELWRSDSFAVCGAQRTSITPKPASMP